MENIRKRKILKFIILILCILIFASAFLVLRRWLHSDGMHFIAGYGQIHLSKMCKGIDHDGNKIEPRNIVIDGTVTKKWGSESFWELNGMVDISNGLPEKVFPSKGAAIVKSDDGVYFMSCIFLDLSKYDVTSEYENWNYEKDNKREYKGCYAITWIKDGEIIMKFYQDNDTDGYYIYYSDIKMLDIEQIQEKINKNII